MLIRMVNGEETAKMLEMFGSASNPFQEKMLSITWRSRRMEEMVAVVATALHLKTIQKKPELVEVAGTVEMQVGMHVRVLSRIGIMTWSR